jgi:esterase/lipase superfamily enzyme
MSDVQERSFTPRAIGRAIYLVGIRIRVPEDHKAGHLELPRGFSSFWLDLTGERPDPKVNFTVSSRQILTAQEWDAVISEARPNDALVFVHGFNTTFDDAALWICRVC